jgi:hypothetical protein
VAEAREIELWGLHIANSSSPQRWGARTVPVAKLLFGQKKKDTVAEHISAALDGDRKGSTSVENRNDGRGEESIDQAE